MRWALGSGALAPVLVAAACGGSPEQPTPPPPPPNPAPVISAVTAGQRPAHWRNDTRGPRVEVGEGVLVAATVSDAETPIAQLTYEWTATAAGTFEGSGPVVTWRPSATVTTPARVDINLTVIERYTVPVRGGVEQRENRTTASTAVQVNDSQKEVRDMALTFLNDFANATNTSESAAFCVRNFSDNCNGKAQELQDIFNIRQRFTTVRSSVRVDRIDFVGERTTAYVYAPCTFEDIERATGRPQPPSAGICALTAVYEPYRWWLCTSNFCDSYDRCNPIPNIGTSLANALRR